MWEKLKSEHKEKYRTLITNFASLSEAFSQKSETAEEVDTFQYVAPIINSKFQETVFQRTFHAVGEDIANTSFDASVVVDNHHKYLVGIKSFGIQSGDQKLPNLKKIHKDGQKRYKRLILMHQLRQIKQLLIKITIPFMKA